MDMDKKWMEIIQTFKKAEESITPLRFAMLRIVFGSRECPTAMQVALSLHPDFSWASLEKIDENLKLFIQLGILDQPSNEHFFYKLNHVSPLV